MCCRLVTINDSDFPILGKGDPCKLSFYDKTWNTRKTTICLPLGQFGH